jgi:hypothetical protein
MGTSRVESYVTTDGQSASLAWLQHKLCVYDAAETYGNESSRVVCYDQPGSVTTTQVVRIRCSGTVLTYSLLCSVTYLPIPFQCS